jgi:hypothetical protein
VTVDQTARSWLQQIARRAVRQRGGRFYVDGVEATCTEAHQLRQIEADLVTVIDGEVLLTADGIKALGPTR